MQSIEEPRNQLKNHAINLIITLNLWNIYLIVEEYFKINCDLKHTNKVAKFLFATFSTSSKTTILKHSLFCDNYS